MMSGQDQGSTYTDVYAEPSSVARDHVAVNVEKNRTQAEVPPPLPPPYHNQMYDPASPLDMEDRDPTNMNELVQVSFQDIFAEPEELHSFESIWHASFIVFTESKFWCYRILTLLCAVPCALMWGITFACLSFTYIWNVVPSLKRLSIQLTPVGQACAMFLGALCEPCFVVMGKCLSSIVVAYKRDDKP